MQTIFDPNAARAFATMLDHQSNELRDHTAQICRSAVELNTSWKDRKYDPFRREFDEATMRLKEFLERAEKYSKHLRKMADIADKYHGR